jgi:glycosyl transferase family 1
MRFYFTEEDHPTAVRANDIRSALVHARHEVVRGRLGVPAPAGTDVWMHGIGIEGSPPIDSDVADQLVSSTAAIAIFQLCDGETLNIDRIPAAVMARTRLFLRNHWPRDRSHLPAPVRSRLGWLPPMVKPMAPCPGKSLVERSLGAMFYGTRTGYGNLGDGRNARDETVRLMRRSGLPFRGGLLSHPDPRYPVDPQLLVPPLSHQAHGRTLQDTRICLAPWGNHPITYRFFEGLAKRCLVVAQSLRDVTFLDAGLEAGTHYVEVAPDLSDLPEVVRYHLAHLRQAQRIADAGHRHFKRWFAGRGRGLVSSHFFDATVASWGDCYRPSRALDLNTLSRSLTALVAPHRF